MPAGTPQAALIVSTYNWPEALGRVLTATDPNGKVVPIYGGLAGASKVPVVRMELLWDKETKSWKKAITGELVDVKGVPADAAFMTRFQPAYDMVKAWVDRPVGKMEGKIYAKDSMTADSAFVDLIHTIQLEITRNPANGLKPADISITAPPSTCRSGNTGAHATIPIGWSANTVSFPSTVIRSHSLPQNAISPPASFTRNVTAPDPV